MYIYIYVYITEHLRWLLLERVCEGTSMIKILLSSHFNIFGMNPGKMLIKNLNNE